MLLHKYQRSYSHVCKYDRVCVCPALTSLLSLGITSYRWRLREGNGLMSQGENIIVALTSVWKCSEWVFYSCDLAGHHQPHQRLHSLHVLPEKYGHIMTSGSSQRHLKVLCVSASRITSKTKVFISLSPLRSGPLSVYLRRCETASVFSQRAEIPAVFSLDHAPVLNIPPQIHIKVCLLKEMLGKYILKLSVTSLAWDRKSVV